MWLGRLGRVYSIRHEVSGLRFRIYENFRKLGVPYFGVLIIRILLLLGSPIFGNSHIGPVYGFHEGSTGFFVGLGLRVLGLVFSLRTEERSSQGLYVGNVVSGFRLRG